MVTRLTGVRHAQRRHRREDDPAGSSAATVGLVESFQHRQVLGWVSASASESPVKVTLHVNDLEVASTWATEPSSHNTDGEVHVFRFALTDLWRFCRTTDRVTVQVSGRPLPIFAKGVFKRPAADGSETLADLRERLAQGYVFSQYGRLQLSKSIDQDWQVGVLDLYQRVSDAVQDRFGHETFVVYGTLLGLVREGGFIGHDVDFDAAYLSDRTAGPAAAAELKEVAFALIDAGLDVQAKKTALHIRDVRDPDLRIDLFHIYFGADGVMAFPFGVAGSSVLRRDDWAGVEESTLAGRPIRRPVNAEAMVEQLYGPGWRSPSPGFNWDRMRVRQAEDGWLRPEQAEEVHWANFYAHTELEGGSTFYDTISARADLPDVVIDIGCGDGRDAFAFARSGRQVIGLDRSHVAIAHAIKKAERDGLTHVLSFVAGDVGDGRATDAVFGRARELAGGCPVLFYLRFFLHSIPEETQEQLLGSIAASAHPGDLLAAEFRTDKDARTEKVHGQHYRRYQDGFALGGALRDRWGWTVLEELESAGLSPYKGEDPVLYRVVGARPH